MTVLRNRQQKHTANPLWASLAESPAIKGVAESREWRQNIKNQNNIWVHLESPLQEKWEKTQAKLSVMFFLAIGTLRLIAE